MPYAQSLEPTFTSRIPQATKAERTQHLVTNNPAHASPKETLYIRVPKLQTGVVLVPDSFELVFYLSTNGVPVQNLSKALIARFIIKFEGEILCDIDHYNLFETYSDIFRERKNMVLYGIQSDELRKLRSGRSEKPT